MAENSVSLAELRVRLEKNEALQQRVAERIRRKEAELSALSDALSAVKFPSTDEVVAAASERSSSESPSDLRTSIYLGHLHHTAASPLICTKPRREFLHSVTLAMKGVEPQYLEVTSVHTTQDSKTAVSTSAGDSRAAWYEPFYLAYLTTRPVAAVQSMSHSACCVDDDDGDDEESDSNHHNRAVLSSSSMANAAPLTTAPTLRSMICRLPAPLNADDVRRLQSRLWFPHAPSVAYCTAHFVTARAGLQNREGKFDAWSRAMDSWLVQLIDEIAQLEIAQLAGQRLECGVSEGGDDPVYRLLTGPQSASIWSNVATAMKRYFLQRPPFTITEDEATSMGFRISPSDPSWFRSRWHDIPAVITASCCRHRWLTAMRPALRALASSSPSLSFRGASPAWYSAEVVAAVMQEQQQSATRSPVSWSTDEDAWLWRETLRHHAMTCRPLWVVLGSQFQTMLRHAERKRRAMDEDSEATDTKPSMSASHAANSGKASEDVKRVVAQLSERVALASRASPYEIAKRYQRSHNPFHTPNVKHAGRVPAIVKALRDAVDDTHTSLMRHSSARRRSVLEALRELLVVPNNSLVATVSSSVLFNAHTYPSHFTADEDQRLLWCLNNLRTHEDDGNLCDSHIFASFSLHTLELCQKQLDAVEGPGWGCSPFYSMTHFMRSKTQVSERARRLLASPSQQAAIAIAEGSVSSPPQTLPLPLPVTPSAVRCGMAVMSSGGAAASRRALQRPLCGCLSSSVGREGQCTGDMPAPLPCTNPRDPRNLFIAAFAQHTVETMPAGILRTEERAGQGFGLLWIANWVLGGLRVTPEMVHGWHLQRRCTVGPLVEKLNRMQQPIGARKRLRPPSQTELPAAALHPPPAEITATVSSWDARMETVLMRVVEALKVGYTVEVGDDGAVVLLPAATDKTWTTVSYYFDVAWRALNSDRPATVEEAVQRHHSGAWSHTTLRNLMASRQQS